MRDQSPDPWAGRGIRAPLRPHRLRRHRGPSGAPRPRAPSRARVPRMRAGQGRGQRLQSLAPPPSFPPSLPGSGISGIPLWDSVPAGPAPRRRGGAGLGEGSANEEREAGEAKVAVRAGSRPESPPGGGGRGAARGAAGEPGVRGHRRGWRRGSGTG